MKKNKLSKFQQKLDDLNKKIKESSNEVSQETQSQTAQTGDIKWSWKSTDDELPPYYAPIHIWDGKIIRENWSRVWSETVGNIYVKDNQVLPANQITHWTPPANKSYPKYDPLTTKDIYIISKKDIQDVIDDLSNDIINPSNIPANTQEECIWYNNGVKNCIIKLNKLLSKRITKNTL